MKKRMLGLLIAGSSMIAIGCWAGLSIAENPLKAPEDELTIEGKKPARFDHPVHLKLGLECGVCHHDQKHEPLTAEAIAGLGDASKLSCVSCHNKSHPDKKLRKAKDVFHARCKTCHKEGYEGKNGPSKCNGCHPRNKKRQLEGC